MKSNFSLYFSLIMLFSMPALMAMDLTDRQTPPSPAAAASSDSTTQPLLRIQLDTLTLHPFAGGDVTDDEDSGKETQPSSAANLIDELTRGAKSRYQEVKQGLEQEDTSLKNLNKELALLDEVQALLGQVKAFRQNPNLDTISGKSFTHELLSTSITKIDLLVKLNARRTPKNKDLYVF